MKRALTLGLMLLATAASSADIALATRHDELTPSRASPSRKVQWAPSGNFSALHTRSVFRSETETASRPYAGERSKTAAGAGIFLSRDSFEGTLNSAPSLHRFTYAHANPLRYTDPTGHCGVPCAVFIGAGLAMGFRSDEDANIGVALPPAYIAFSMAVENARAGVEERRVLALGNSSPATEAQLLAAQERQKDARLGFVAAAVASPARLSVAKSPFEGAAPAAPAPFVRSTRPRGGYGHEGGESITEPEAGTPQMRNVQKSPPYDEVAAIAAAESEGMALSSGPQNKVGPVKGGVGANKESGDAVRDAIARREGWPTVAAETEVTMTTVGGQRRIDVLPRPPFSSETIAIESKVGRTGLTERVRQELARDWWLRRQGQVDKVKWEFSPSEVTNEGGPTKTLQEKLDKLEFETKLNKETPK